MYTQRTIGEWVGFYLTDRRASNLAQGSLRFYKQKLEVMEQFCRDNGVTNVEAITPDLLRRWLLDMEDKGHNPGGVHAGFRTARAFLRWYELEVDPRDWRNPIKRVKAPRMAQELLEPVELTDVEALIRVCDTTTFNGLRDRAMLICLLDTGCRASEFLAVDYADLNVDSGAIIVRQGKGRKYRTVFLGQKARRALRAYLRFHPADSGPLWVTSQGTRLEYRSLRSIVERRSRLAGIKMPTLHSFRRAFALNALRSGMDVYSLKTLMGHSDLQILQRYLKQTDGDLMAAHRLHSPADKLS